MIRSPLAALAVLAAITLIALTGAIGWPDASAQSDERSLTAQVAARRAADGTIEFCVDLGAARERVCPQRQRLSFADAPDGRWLTSEWFFIAPETSLRIRARRLGERLEFGLQLNADGTRETLLPRRRFLTWERTPIGQWQRSSTVALRLPAQPHWELNGQGIAPGAGRLTLDQPAPEFRLPTLDPNEPLATLSELRAPGRATIIAFWASWAPYALDTLASLERLASQRALTLIAINVYEAPREAEAALRDQPTAVAIHLHDASGAVARHYRVDGLPEIFLLDANGVYRAVIRGAAPLDEISAAFDALE